MKIERCRTFGGMLIAAFVVLVGFCGGTAMAASGLTAGNTAALVGPAGAVTAKFPVSLTAPVSGAVTVQYATSDGTAKAGVDYTATSGTVTFAAGITSETVPVTVLGTTADASGLTFTLVLSNPVNATLSSGTGTCTITHDSAPVPIGLTPLPETTFANSDVNLSSTVTDVNGASDISGTILTIGKGSSQLQAHYSPSTNLLSLTGGSGSFAPGSANVITTALGSLNCAQTTIDRGGDGLIVNWSLTPATGLIGAQPTSVYANNPFNQSSTVAFSTWNIVPADLASIANTTVLAGPSGTVYAGFHVSLLLASSVPVSMTYATADGTAKAGTDYTAVSGTVTIPAGSTNSAIIVPVLGTTADASGLQFEMVLSNPVNANIDPSTAVCTITHDVAPTVSSLTPLPETTGVDAPATFTSTIYDANGPSDVGSVILTLGKGTNLLKAQYSVSTGLVSLSGATGSFAPGTSNVLTTTLGSLNCGLTSVTSNSTGLVINWTFLPASGMIGAQPTSVYVNNKFNQSSTTTFGAWTVSANLVSAANTSVLVGPAGSQTALIPLTLGAVSSVPVMVSYATANGTAVAGTDYTAASGTVTIPAGSLTGYIPVPVLGTTVDASGLTFGVTLSNPVNAAIGTPIGTCTIVHDVAPAPSGLTPSPVTSGTYSSELFTSTINDANGASDIGSVIFTIGQGATQLRAQYVPSTNLLSLSGGSGSYVAGSSNVITSSLASLNCAQSTVSSGGNSLIIHWSLTPTSALAGPQPLWIYANNKFNQSNTVSFSPWTILSIIPANDNFASAQAISGTSGTVTGTTANSTLETGEPNTVSGDGSVWFAYTAPSTAPGLVTFDQLSGPSLTYHVYTGTSFSNLSATPLGTNSLSFGTRLGQTYYIQIEGSPTGAAFTYSWNWTTQTIIFNDDFANAAALSGNGDELAGPLLQSTLEVSEPNSSQMNGSVWASLTDGNGWAGLTDNTPDANRHIDVYTGTSLSNLTLVAGGGDAAYFPTVAGTTYYIQIGDSGTDTAGFVMTTTWSASAAPANDNFANAQVISGSPGSVSGTTIGASTEPGDPANSASTGTDSDQTVWYQYTAGAGANTALYLSLSGDTQYQYIGVYTGSILAGLTKVVGGDNSAQFALSPGVTYDIEIASSAYVPSNFTLGWSVESTLPSNDNFAGAASLSGASGSAPGTTVGASTESGEPGTSGSTATVWYRYTASAPGSLTLQLSNESPAQTVNVYSGSALANLTLQTGTNNVYTTAAATYYIQVESTGSNTSSFTLSYSWTATTNAANDNFANAQAISGTSGTVAGSTAYSTLESGEPNAVSGDGSVWYAYTAPSTAPGSVTFTQTSGTTLSYHVYTGTALTNLVATPLGTSTFFFGTSLGQKYYLQIEGPSSGTPFTYSWNWTTQTILTNDDFAKATAMTGNGDLLSEPLLQTTLEAGEPNSSQMNGSVWAALTDGNGWAGVTDNTPDANRHFNVYTGTSLSNLTLIAGGGDGAFFPTVAGTTYYIQIGDSGTDTAGFGMITTWSASAPPANDNFANATVLSGTSGSVNGTTVGASTEPGDPGISTAAGYASDETVWYRYTAPASTNPELTLSLSGDSVAEAVEVYQGTSVASLTPLVSGTNFVSFAPQAGATYQIEIGSINYLSTSFTMNWSLTSTAPSNDDFVGAQAMTGATGSVSGSTVGASVESGEPGASGSYATVWYSYTATGAGSLTLQLSTETVAQTIKVYTGSTLANLTLQTGANNVYTTAAATYYIQVESAGSNVSAFTLSYSWTATANVANDNFANAQAISGASGSATGTTVGATTETGEPGISGSSNTVWYRYTASAEGFLGLNLSADPVAQTFNVYTGSSVSALTSVSLYESDYLVYAGTTYYIQVEGANANTGAFTLNWLWVPVTATPNDDFENPAPITYPDGSSGSLLNGATLEAGEPNPCGVSSSDWWTITSAGAGWEYVNDNSGDPNQFLVVYTGTSFSNLTEVGQTSTSLQFPTTAGTIYYVQVGDTGTDTTGASFQYLWAGLANDNFANAQVLTGTNGFVYGTTDGATVEAGEPTAGVSTTHTIWYAFTTPSTSAGTLHLILTQEGINQTVTIYSGTWGNLTQVVTGTNSAWGSVLPSTTYYIQVESTGDATSVFQAGWGWTATSTSSYSGSGSQTLGLPAAVRRSGHSA